MTNVVVRRMCRVVMAAVVGVVGLGWAPIAAEEIDDNGFSGASYAGAYLEPSGSKPQSKLWHHDGRWFGVLFHTPSATFRIHRLDRRTATWVDTGVVVDDRMNSRTDALVSGDKLYIASHRYSKTAASGSFPAHLLRYSYDPTLAQWSLDTGFPTRINTIKSESLVIDRDSTGRLWATWTRGLKVWVNRTIGDDRTWGTPFELPTSTTIQEDDISSVIAFGGTHIGVFWGDQNGDAYRFSVHRDGDPDTSWSAPETVIGGFRIADDHLNLKASSDGRVFAAVKTGVYGDDDPLVVLAVRSPSGSWTTSTVATNRYSHTRPIVVLAEGRGQVHVLLTGPQPPSTSGQKGGDIYAKVASIDDPVFEDGPGRRIMRAAGASDLNNVTSTKQSVTASTGLVAVASAQSIERYWHADIAIGAGGPTIPPPPPSPPASSFDVSTARGAAPLSVDFTDTTTGDPTGWTWRFGDGAESTEQHPSHVFSVAGTYVVELTARNESGSTTSSATITVDPPEAPGQGESVTLGAIEDTYVSSSSPTSKAGTSSFLRVQDGSATYRSFMKFDVPAAERPIARAVLRLYAVSNTADAGAIAPAASTWSESATSWSNAPAIGGVVAGVGPITSGTWIEIDVTSAISSGGMRTLALTGGSGSSAWFSSRQGANPPELVITAA